MCDFSTGFEAPEMVKKRPVVVLSTGKPGVSELVTVVPLSTTDPTPVQSYHLQLDKKQLPKTAYFMNADNCWIKGDMIYTVGYKRLSPVQIGRTPEGKRVYYQDRFGRETMKLIYGCVLCGLNLPSLAQYL